MVGIVEFARYKFQGCRYPGNIQRYPIIRASRVYSIPEVQGADAQQDAAALGSAIKETEREKQIRLGLITPFQNLPGFSRGVVRRTGAPLPTLDHFSPSSTLQEPTVRTNQATKQVLVLRVATGAQPSSGADGEVPFSEAARRKLENTATYLVNAAKQSEANAPKTQLLEASELEEEDLRGVTKTEYFLPKSSTRFGRGPAGTFAITICALPA